MPPAARLCRISPSRHLHRLIGPETRQDVKKSRLPSADRWGHATQSLSILPTRPSPSRMYWSMFRIRLQLRLRLRLRWDPVPLCVTGATRGPRVAVRSVRPRTVSPKPPRSGRRGSSGFDSSGHSGGPCVCVFGEAGRASNVDTQPPLFAKSCPAAHTSTQFAGVCSVCCVRPAPAPAMRGSIDIGLSIASQRVIAGPPVNRRPVLQWCQEAVRAADANQSNPNAGHAIKWFNPTSSFRVGVSVGRCETLGGCIGCNAVRCHAMRFAAGHCRLDPRLAYLLAHSWHARRAELRHHDDGERIRDLHTIARGSLSSRLSFRPGATCHACSSSLFS